MVALFCSFLIRSDRVSTAGVPERRLSVVVSCYMWPLSVSDQCPRLLITHLKANYICPTTTPHSPSSESRPQFHVHGSRDTHSHLLLLLGAQEYNIHLNKLYIIRYPAIAIGTSLRVCRCRWMGCFWRRQSIDKQQQNKKTPPPHRSITLVICGVDWPALRARGS